VSFQERKSAMAPLKRPAAAAATAPAPKKPATAVQLAAQAKKCDMVCDAVMMAEDLPLTTRQLLCAGLPETAKVLKGERHPFQIQLVDWVDAALKAVEAAAKQRLEAAEGKVAKASAEKEARAAAEASAKAELDGKVEAAKAKAAALSEANRAHVQAKEALSKAEETKSEGDASLIVQAEEKSKLDTALDDVFAKLKVGGVDRAELDELLLAVGELAEALRIDQAMLTSLPAALGKSPEDRGTFDNLVVEQFESLLREKIAALDAALKDAEPAKQERVAKVEAAKAAVDACMNTVTACQDEAVKASEEKHAAEETTKVAAKAFKSLGAEIKAAEAALEAEKKYWNRFEHGALAAFQELKELDSQTTKGSQYTQIGGVRYEKDLLAIADEETPISAQIAERIFTAAMDGNGVTPTEKRTVRYILKNRAVTEDAKVYLETQIGTSWYQTIEGVQYERALLQIAADEEKPLAEASVAKLWESAQDANVVTPCERRTLEYILKTQEFTSEAKADLEAKMQTLQEVGDD